MTVTGLLELDEMRENAGEAADFLRALSNRPRLLVMCHLVDAQELSVGQLVERVGISQSALSQHLAKLRDQSLVAYRREGQTLFYRVCDRRAERILETLHELFCSPEPNRAVIDKDKTVSLAGALSGEESTRNSRR